MSVTRSLLAASQENENILQTLKKQALPELIHSITDKKPGTSLRVTYVVGDADDHLASQYLVRAYEQTNDEGVHCKIIESIGKSHDGTRWEWLSQHLEDPHISIQCFTIWAMGELRDSRTLEILRRKLWSSNHYVQMTAIDALGKMPRNANVAMELSAFLRDEDVQVRFLAGKALLNVAGPYAVPEIAERLREEPSIDVQEALARALGRAGGAVGVGRLIELLKNPPSQATEHWAEVGLKAADPAIVVPAIAPLMESDDFRLKVSAARVVSELETLHSADGSMSWMKYITRWENGSDLVARAAAVRLMERMKSAP